MVPSSVQPANVVEEPDVVSASGGNFTDGCGCISPDLAVQLFRAVRKKLTRKGEEVVATQKTQVSFIKVGETNLELLLPTAADSPVAKFLETRGEGFHHLALEVEDIDSAVEELKAAGVRLIDETPREGAHGSRVAFIHPKSTFGVLLELVQYTEPH